MEPDRQDRPLLLGWRARAVAVALGVLAVAAIAWGVLTSSAVGEVEIPPTTGLTVEEAQVALEEVGLQLGEPVAETSVDIDEGLVVRTDPLAGDVIAAGSEVALVISTGPAKIPVPELVGLPLEEAEQVLVGEGLELGEIGRSDSSRPRDEVLRSDPVFGDVLEEGTPVSLTAATGSNSTPEVIGLTEDRARAVLESAGFEVDVDVENRVGARSGRVTEVAPAAGVRQEVGSAVTIVVTGPAGQGTATGSATATLGGPSSATETRTATVTETQTVTEVP